MTKVLIVDDDKNMVFLLTKLLQMDGYQVVSEARPAEVLNTIRREKPNVVLMDVHLADGNGLEILMRIRSDAEIGKTPVVIASGEDVAYKGQQGGADGFILKPYPPDALNTVLKKAMGGATHGT
ncbi:MAG: response regulator [Chloroflexi bacterium]|nr:response regulator [Chloroflexota bacterium]